METLAIPSMPREDADITPVFHSSVLPNESLAMLDVRPNDAVVDATLGGAGHFSLILNRLGQDGVLVGIDADPAALERAKEVVGADMRFERPSVHLVEDNFRNLSSILDALGITTIDKAFFDLGWSGFQLGGGKGFSFRTDEPLLMTYGRAEKGKTAADLVNMLSEEELADLIYLYGEEHKARVIARAIVAARKQGYILSTKQLADVVESAVRGPRGKTHPATKTFQALRIAVNDEFGAIDAGLSAAFERLAPGGRLAVISFHSSEDRAVKLFMKARAEEGSGLLVTKKPIVPSRAEILTNRRSRSAKLRVIEKAAVAEDVYA